MLARLAVLIIVVVTLAVGGLGTPAVGVTCSLTKLSFNPYSTPPNQLDLRNTVTMADCSMWFGVQIHVIDPSGRDVNAGDFGVSFFGPGTYSVNFSLYPQGSGTWGFYVIDAGWPPFSIPWIPWFCTTNTVTQVVP